MAQIEVACPSCRKLHAFSDLVPFRAECDACSADLHVCITCRFHDRYVENECREDSAEPVAKKDRANLCEYWKPLPVGGASEDPAAAAKARLAALFGGSGTAPTGAGPAAPAPTTPAAPASSGSAADEAKRKLEELFKKK